MAKTPYHKNYAARPNVFTKILEDGAAKGILPGRSRDARNWYRKKALEITSIDRRELMSSDPARYRQSIELGRMYMFYYDPKHRKTLPYFDRLPLIIPIQHKADGFLGINLHYLPPIYRAQLMDALYGIINNLEFNNTTKIGSPGQRDLYRIMKVIPKMRNFKPCIKRYLKPYVRSRFVSIASTEWDIALGLPLAEFNKAPARQVWADSVRKIRGG
jgi:hypothetical protein